MATAKSNFPEAQSGTEQLRARLAPNHVQSIKLAILGVPASGRSKMTWAALLCGRQGNPQRQLLRTSVTSVCARVT